MYYADSDILTVVLTLITMAAGIYSSVKSGKKKKGELDRRKVRSRATVAETVETENQMVEDEDEESPFFSLESILQEISNEREEESALEEFVYEGKSAVEQPQAAQWQTAEELQTPEEVVVSVTEKYQDNREFPQEASEESRSTGIKERLKASPKDAVIFAEILKPKYKEF
ncbi:MAG: hypothetical protein IIW25_00755 [Bacteroidales bacterium]|nr:hypothetical protein [Bacteroidales bacterium]